MSVSVLCQYPSDNVAGAYATIGVNSGSEDSDYPAAYLADGRPGRPAKLTTTSGSWVIAFSAPQPLALVALGAHNLDAATLEGNETNDWGSPVAFSQAFIIPSATADGHSGNAWMELAAGSPLPAYQYWRLVVSGSVPCAVGELWMGSTIRLWERAYQGGFSLSETHATIAHLTEFLVPHVYALGSRQRRMQLTIRASEAGAAELREWYRAMKGPGLTGLVIPDAADNDAWWVRQAEDYTETVLYPSVRDVSMTLVEHATGVPL